MSGDGEGRGSVGGDTEAVDDGGQHGAAVLEGDAAAAGIDRAGADATATVAVKVTDWPATELIALEVSVVVVPAWWTV